jgi:hypothetical protein
MHATISTAPGLVRVIVPLVDHLGRLGHLGCKAQPHWMGLGGIWAVVQETQAPLVDCSIFGQRGEPRPEKVELLGPWAYADHLKSGQRQTKANQSRA